MIKFGTKETWMEPMNKFLASATPEFRDFVDQICSINSTQPTASMEPQYAASNQIKNRLPLFSQEGLPSLPFLLDPTKVLADLVALWAAHGPNNLPTASGEQALRRFDALCRELHQRSEEYLSSAEQAEKPDAKMESKWQQALKEQQKTRDVFEQHFMTPANNDPDLTALPQPVDAQYGEQHMDVIGESDTTPSSAASAAGWDRRAAFTKTTENKALTSSTNSSTASLEPPEERRPPPPGSRDGKKNARLFDLMSSSGRRKGRDRGYAQDEGNEI